MPLPESVRDYRALLDHVETLHAAVSREDWETVAALWFDQYAIHRQIAPPSIDEKPLLETVIARMGAITELLKQRRDDIALLLRIAP